MIFSLVMPVVGLHGVRECPRCRGRGRREGEEKEAEGLAQVRSTSSADKMAGTSPSSTVGASDGRDTRTCKVCRLCELLFNR